MSSLRFPYQATFKLKYIDCLYFEESERCGETAGPEMGVEREGILLELKRTLMEFEIFSNRPSAPTQKAYMRTISSSCGLIFADLMQKLKYTANKFLCPADANVAGMADQIAFRRAGLASLLTI